jgi:glutathione synthase/RimK-type ligase-like ATP-grasp enzyme
MAVLIVVEKPELWPWEVPQARMVSARDYLTDPEFIEMKRAKVFNLCRSYGYQSIGYYVSLLAEARGHKPMPSVTTVQDLKQSSLIRIVSEDIEDLVQKGLAPIKSDRFELSIYFGRNLAQRYDRLCQALFNHFPAPLLRAGFVLASDEWHLNSLRPIALNEIPDSHREFVIQQAKSFFERPRISSKESARYRYELAILAGSEDVSARPSDDRAVKRFVRAGEKVGMDVTIIDREDYGRIAEFDALFIRETTAVNHHTYRFARRAEAEGMIVIDDPRSIVRCTNKVYQAELFDKHAIQCPKTIVVHRDNARQVGSILGFPCVLKQPDSSFSAGVVKADNDAELAELLSSLIQKSELIVAQEFVRSTFDWRVGVLDGRPLYVCRYHMARGHWQIQKIEKAKRPNYGKVDTIDVDAAPPQVVDLAVRAAKLIGDGLYGVDIKEADGRFLIIEINDNPSIDAGNEDGVLKDELYLRIMRCFRERLERRRQ